MKKIISYALTFVAISLVIAVVAMKYIVPPANVQIEALPVAGVSSSSSTDIKTDATSPIDFNLVDESGAAFTGENLKGKVSIVNFVCTKINTN